MANEEKDVLLDIQVRYEDAIEGIAKYTQAIDNIKVHQADLKKTLRDGEISQEEYTKAFAASKIEIDNNKEAIRILEKEIKNNIKSEKAHKDSLVALRAQLSNVTREYDLLSKAERESAKGQELQDKINSITDDLSEAEEATQRFYRNVGNYPDASASLEHLGGQIEGTSKMSMGLAQSVLGINSAMSMFGDQSEENAERAKKLQQIIALLSLAQQVNTNVLKEGVRMSKLSTIQDGIRTTQIKAKTAAEAASTKGTIIATAKQKIFNLVAAANPYVLLAIALITVVGALAMFAVGTKKASDEQKAYNDVTKKAVEGFVAEKTELDKLEKTLKSSTATTKEKEAAVKTLNEKYLDSKHQLKGVSEAETWMVNNKDKVVQALKERAIAAAAYELAIESNKKALEAQNKSDQEYISGFRRMFMTQAGEARLAEKRREKDIAKYEADTNQYLDIQQNAIDAEEEISKELGLKASEAIKTAGGNREALLKEMKRKEQELVRKAEDVTLSLMEEGLEKQRKAIELSYSRQIEDLKRQLKEEANLTEAARKAINDTIVGLEDKKTQELNKLSEQEIANLITKETQRINLLLSTIKKSSEEEFDLRKKLNEQNRLSEIASNNALVESMRQSEADINAKYAKLESDLIKEQNRVIAENRAKALQEEVQNRLLKVQEGSLAEFALKTTIAQEEYDYLDNLDAQSKAAMFESDLAYTNAVLENKRKLEDATIAQIEAEKEATAIQLQAAQKIGAGFQEVLEAFAEDNEALAEFAKAVAVFNIALSTAEAIAAIPAMSAMGDPYTYAVRVAAAVATVFSNIAKAKQILTKEKSPKAPKFARGGGVTGAGTGTSDSISARLSSGESVQTALSTSMFSPLLSATNQMGGGVPINVAQTSNQIMGEEMLARAFAKGVASMPSPIVSVQEIDTVGAKVKVYETLITQ